MTRNSKKMVIITVSILTLSCLSGCHKDKPVESQAPLETIQPDTSSETISDKLGEDQTLSIEEAPESLSEDALVIGYDTGIDKSEISNDETDTSESESLTDTEESAENSTNNTETSSASEKETLSESEAQAVLESEIAERESVQESADDWYEQNKAMESAANNYYDKIQESIMSQEGIEDRLNPYK